MFATPGLRRSVVSSNMLLLYWPSGKTVIPFLTFLCGLVSENVSRYFEVVDNDNFFAVVILAVIIIIITT